jgi:hypothetical protein
MTSKNFLSALILAAILLFAACEKGDPIIPNEEELITTLVYQLTPVGGGSTITLTFKDLDGDGGTPPVILGSTLQANQTYTATLDLLNEVASPAERITDEIRAEDEAHQFFFQSSVPGLTVTYSDTDANQNPVGLSTTLSTGAIGSGSLTIILRHEPNKTASGVAEGDMTNAGGETDIEVIFPIDVQ